jgi:hypothetical protein
MDICCVPVVKRDVEFGTVRNFDLLLIFELLASSFAHIFLFDAFVKKALWSD